MRFLRLVLICFLLVEECSAQQASSRPKIGVALEGGGAKGLAHIGVLKWFEDHHIPIDYIAGTSMGGLVGGLYATGYSPDEIAGIVKQIDWERVMTGKTDYPDLAFRRKEDFRALPNSIEFGLRNGFQAPGGLNSGQEVRLIIDHYVFPYSAVANFDMLPTPFRCVATDLVSGKPVIFRDGSLANALRATMSIPGVFSPLKQDGMVLADGGLLNNLPTDVVKQMGADIVIGVHLSTGIVSPQNLTSLFQVAGGASDVMIGANELRGIERSDILITVELAGYTTLDFSRAEKIIPLGTTAAENKAGVLSRFSEGDDDWKRYTAARESRKVKDPPIPSFVAVNGTSPDVAKALQEELAPSINKPIDTSDVASVLRREVGIGRLNSLGYALERRDGKTGLVLDAEEKEYSPPWIKPALSIDGSDPNNVQFTLGARITDLGVGSYRSELRTDFSIGSSYTFATEYFHPFSDRSRWFVAPIINAGHRPINLYSSTHLLAEYRANQANGGIDLGYSIDRFSEFRVGYQGGYERIYRWVGSPLLPSVSGRTGESRIQYALDRLDNPIIPGRGVALLASSSYLDANPGAAKGIPTARLTVQGFLPVGKTSSVYGILDGATTFGVTQTGIPLYGLGGPVRLAAYGVNEFLTDRYLYGRLGYLHQLLKMPPLIGSGLYLDAHYEAASTDSLFSHSRLPNDGVVGVIAETLLGPLLIGGSIGDAGHQKWFFQFGRVF